jgi:hypothetical protein
MFRIIKHMFIAIIFHFVFRATLERTMRSVITKEPQISVSHLVYLNNNQCCGAGTGAGAARSRVISVAGAVAASNCKIWMNLHYISYEKVLVAGAVSRCLLGAGFASI